MKIDDWLVVAWREEGKLKFTTSLLGVDWTTPVETDEASSRVTQPALVSHDNRLWLAHTSTNSVRLRLIHADLSWGAAFNVYTKSINAELLPSVSLASNGDRLSLGFSERPDKNLPNNVSVKVTHAATGSSTWSTPTTVASDINVQVAPTVAYFDGYLYAAFPTPSRILTLRSRDGVDWNVPAFAVESNADSRHQMVALTRSLYSLVLLTPPIVDLIDSGHPASDVMNIVIVSDGFTSETMSEYHEFAESVAELFRATNPFSKHTDKFKREADRPSVAGNRYRRVAGSRGGGAQKGAGGHRSD